MAISARTLRLERDLQATLARVTDEQARDMVAAWATAWDEVAGDLHDTLVDMLGAGDGVTRAQLLRSIRLRAALAYIADELQDLAREAGVRITADLADVIDRAAGAQASVIDSQLPPGATQGTAPWSRIDERQIAAIVARSTEQVTALTRPLSAEAYATVRRELIRGVAAGSNPRTTAARMVRNAERGFNGGLTRALVISRTETLDAHRAAAQVAQQAAADVLQGWVWTAAISERTCPACLSMHGQVFALDEPGPLGHQQCRCDRVPITRSWADLGFTGVEEPASLLPDSRAFFDSLSAGEQRRILGPARYQAWAAGEFPMDQWAVRRSTEGWRDSFVVAPAPQSRGRRRSPALAS